MKKYRPFILLLVLCCMAVLPMSAQQIDFEMKYNDSANQYEVYAIPYTDNARYYVGGGSQLSLLIPRDIEDGPLSINTVAGGLWVDNSQIYEPEASSAYDFHGIASNGSALQFVGKEKLLLFTFELPLVGCRSDVRLFENGSDPGPSAGGMEGGDFNNFFANVFAPTENGWTKNKQYVNSDCPHAPIVEADLLTIEQNQSGTICLPIYDPNKADAFSAALCQHSLSGGRGEIELEVSDRQLCMTYKPAKDYTGSEEVCVEVCDQTGLCNFVKIAILVTPSSGCKATPYLSAVNTITLAEESCEKNGWTYYYSEQHPEQALFAIEHHPAGGNTNDFEVAVSINTKELSNSYGAYLASEPRGQEANCLMGRYWNAQLTSGSLNGPVNVRFYYDPLELQQAATLAKSFASRTTPALKMSNAMWFYTSNQSFESSMLSATTINDDAIVVVSDPLLDEEDEVHYVQLNGLRELSGGGAAYRVSAAIATFYAEPTAINNSSEEDQSLVFPNPASLSDDLLNVCFLAKTKTVNLVISDPAGQVYRRMTLDVELGLNTIQVNISSLKSGNYFILVKGERQLGLSFSKVDER